jgi:hypothetical protein
MDLFDETPQDFVASDECDLPLGVGDHVCEVGGGSACYSWDFGKTWRCRKHVWPGFNPPHDKTGKP